MTKQDAKAQRLYRKQLNSYLLDVKRSLNDEKELLNHANQKVVHHSKRIKDYFTPAVASTIKQIKEIDKLLNRKQRH